MAGETVDVLDTATAAVVDRCQGPTAAGDCPWAGQGAVPCSGRLIRPAHSDPRHWPMWVPPDSRHCPLGYARRATDCLRKAEGLRDSWLAGLERENAYVRRRVAAGDRQFTNTTPAELARIGLLRWSGSPYAQELANCEQVFRQRAQAYLAFARVHPYRYPEER